ncbi:MAG: sigma-70 family RNA polymerase sigma factor [Pseudomonadota bacterium]
MHDLAEQDLVERAANGCHQSFANLVEHYRDRLFRFLALRCANREDAEDAVQEAFVAAWRYLPSYDARWRFSTWLYRIGLRNLPKARPASEPLGDHEAPGTDALGAAEIDNLWRLAREHLSPDACAALWLRYGEDMSIRDTAKTLSRSVPWVKVSLLRSRRQLAAVADGA